jgi:hypothetical protein
MTGFPQGLGAKGLVFGGDGFGPLAFFGSTQSGRAGLDGSEQTGEFVKEE